MTLENSKNVINKCIAIRIIWQFDISKTVVREQLIKDVAAGEAQDQQERCAKTDTADSTWTYWNPTSMARNYGCFAETFVKCKKIDWQSDNTQTDLPNDKHIWTEHAQRFIFDMSV